MIDFLNNIDASLLLWINGLHCDMLDPWMRRFSKAGPWVVMYAAIVWTMFRAYGWRRALICIAGAALAVGLADCVCASVLRPMICRLRPSNLDNPLSQMVHVVNGYRSGAYGFPSCHGANTFALAVFTSMLFRQRLYTAWIFTWALAQCWSRAYLGVHYPGDLLAGACIGAAFALGSYCAMIRILRIPSVKAHVSDTLPQPLAARLSLPTIISGIATCVFLIF